MPSSRELIGLDIGRAKTGLARASTIAKLAEPLESVETEELAKQLNQLLDAKDVEAVVVGLPRNLSGEDTAQTSWVRDFVKRLQTEAKVDFYWQDEALTSREAAKYQISNIKHQTFDNHASAAAIILQDWLDSPEETRKKV